MVCKVSAICLIALLLLSFTFTSTYAGRYQLSFTDVTPVEAYQHDELKGGIDEAVDNKKFQEEESCERGDDEVECLMRRTLAAHIDYIYTQKQNP